MQMERHAISIVISLYAHHEMGGGTKNTSRNRM